MFGLFYMLSVGNVEVPPSYQNLTSPNSWALGTCGLTTLEEGVMYLDVGHRALGALEPPDTYVEEECLS
jgi:hypothetical protein